MSESIRNKIRQQIKPMPKARLFSTGWNGELTFEQIAVVGGDYSVAVKHDARGKTRNGGFKRKVGWQRRDIQAVAVGEGGDIGVGVRVDEGEVGDRCSDSRYNRYFYCISILFTVIIGNN